MGRVRLTVPLQKNWRLEDVLKKSEGNKRCFENVEGLMCWYKIKSSF